MLADIFRREVNFTSWAFGDSRTYTLHCSLQYGESFISYTRDQSLSAVNRTCVDSDSPPETIRTVVGCTHFSWPPISVGDAGWLATWVVRNTIQNMGRYHIAGDTLELKCGLHDVRGQTRAWECLTDFAIQKNISTICVDLEEEECALRINATLLEIPSVHVNARPELVPRVEEQDWEKTEQWRAGHFQWFDPINTSGMQIGPSSQRNVKIAMVFTNELVVLANALPYMSHKGCILEAAVLKHLVESGEYWNMSTEDLPMKLWGVGWVLRFDMDLLSGDRVCDSVLAERLNEYDVVLFEEFPQVWACIPPMRRPPGLCVCACARTLLCVDVR